MKQSISKYQFRDAFVNYSREDNFSYDGLNALFDYLEQYEEDCDTEIELDVIALCCEYSEMTIDEVVNDYIHSDWKGGTTYDQTAYDDLKEIEDDAEPEDVKEYQRDYILEWLKERTQVITVDDDTVIIQQF